MNVIKNNYLTYFNNDVKNVYEKRAKLQQCSDAKL